MKQAFVRARKVGVAVATVVGMAITAALGQWQLGRASQKEERFAQQQARAGLPALGWADLQQAQRSGAWASLLERPVSLRGTWVARGTVYLDNRPLHGQAGYLVLTPFQSSTGHAVLVQRAWVPRRQDDRLAVLRLATPNGEMQLQGHVAPPPSKLFELGSGSPGQVRQNVDVAAYAQELSLPLLAVSVRQSAAAADLPPGASREWPVPTADVHKHYGYALQWYGLCSLMAILYVWFQIIAPRRRV